MRSVIITLVVALAAASWTEECARHCTHDQNHLKAEALVAGCETYRYVLPRPKVYRVCKTAFDTAVQNSCSKVCSTEHNYGYGHVSDGAHQHCKSKKDTVPKPVSHEACVKGYMKGSMAAVDYATAIKKKHDEAMATGDGSQDTAAADAQLAVEAARAAAQAEAAAAQAKVQAEAAKAKAQAAAEAAEKKKEEESIKEAAAAQAEAEAAKKAAEEKKAREMEAARAAARAAYSKAQQEEAAAAAAEEPAATEPVANLRGGDEVAQE